MFLSDFSSKIKDVSKTFVMPEKASLSRMTSAMYITLKSGLNGLMEQNHL